MIILGIETSCDETAAAVVEGKNGRVKVLSNVISSQVAIHQKYGGVVPEVAAREHILNILPVINEALRETQKKDPSLIREDDFICPPCQGLPARTRLPETGTVGQELALQAGRIKGVFRKFNVKKNIKSPLTPFFKGGKGSLDAIAVTTGPGLITSLMVGVETAKTLAYVWGIPLISVNHVEGHIYANFINRRQTTDDRRQTIKFPALILTVSGGHNMLVLMKGHGQYKIIGETIDDAAGEAFDKAASMLGLGYPGGPAISTEAEKYILTQKNLPLIPSPPARDWHCRAGLLRRGEGWFLPRPMINSKDYNFSFSGLKTALLYQIKKDPHWPKRLPEYAAEFQQAVIDVLILKTIKAAEEFKVKTIMLTGGVAANKELRRQLKEAVKKNVPCSMFHIPCLQFTTDNAAMIATAGYYKAMAKRFTPWQKLKTDPNLVLKSWAAFRHLIMLLWRLRLGH